MVLKELLTDLSCKNATSEGGKCASFMMDRALSLGMVYEDSRKYWRLHYKIHDKEKSLSWNVSTTPVLFRYFEGIPGFLLRFTLCIPAISGMFQCENPVRKCNCCYPTNAGIGFIIKLFSRLRS